MARTAVSIEYNRSYFETLCKGDAVAAVLYAAARDAAASRGAGYEGRTKSLIHTAIGTADPAKKTRKRKRRKR